MRIGIDLGGSNIRLGVVDKGVVRDKIAESCKSKESEQVVLDQLISMISAKVSKDVGSIGIGVPSIVDAKQGVVYNVENIPSWREVHLKDILEKVFNLPVSVNNDCNCFALGEYFYGGAQDYNNLVFIALGTGVGAGVIVNKQLYGGENTCAGEIGAVPYLAHNYEYYCGSQFFLREYGISGKQAYEQALQAQPQALEIWKAYGEHLANLVKLVLFTYDPQVIFLGGSLSRAFEFFSEAMYQNLSDFPYPEMVKKIRIEKSKDDDIAILGAAMLSSSK